MELEYQDWARLQGRGLHTGGPKGRLVGWRMWSSLGTDNDPPADSDSIIKPGPAKPAGVHSDGVAQENAGYPRRGRRGPSVA